LRRADRDHRIEVRCRDTDCDLYEGGALRGRLENVPDSEGRVGLLLVEKGEAVFRNLIVEEIP
jgi:hypothetical protein